MDSTKFQEGMSVEAFIQSMEESIQEKFKALLEESRADFVKPTVDNALPSGLNVAVIAEPWSGDVLYNLPPLIVLVDAYEWNISIFPRDQHLDLIKPYKKDGIYLSIPVVIFYDRSFNELGHWIERPQVATEAIDRESLALRRRLREENKSSWRDATTKELRTLLRA